MICNQPHRLGIHDVALLLVAAVLACARVEDASTASSVQLAGPGIAARSANGMVVSGAPLATAVGVRVLEAGGNSVDAAVATAFALAVVEPTMSGIGGRTQLLLRDPDGNVAAIDGTTEVPLAYTGGPDDDEDAYGYSTIAVPGTVAALAKALRDHGTWSLSRVLEPAIDLAESGFALPDAEAARIAAVARRLREFDASRGYFLKPDGSPYAAGERFRQPDLAATLRAVAEGGEDAFYRGDIARRMVADIRANAGLVTEDDLAAYRAVESIVVRGHYRGHELIGSYLPASGATTIEILQILDGIEPAPLPGSAAWIATVGQALLIGFVDRTADVAPPAKKAEWLVSRELAVDRARLVMAPVMSGGEEHESANTTHVSVADRHGGVVALTQSVGPTMGSKAAAPGLGFVHAATMEYLGELEPDTRRHWSSQSPLIILRDGQPLYVMGGAGARRILSGMVETISRAIDERLPLDRALASPRFHPTPRRIDVEMRPETAWPDAVLQRLRDAGHRIIERDDAPWFARINAIEWDRATAEWVGVADPRWQGAAGSPAR